MKRSEDRILTTHVGSLIRPPELRAESQDDAFEAPDVSVQLRAAVRDVVHRQVEVGLDVVNDGEYGKFSWSNYILDRISGSGFQLRFFDSDRGRKPLPQDPLLRRAQQARQP